MTTQRCLGGLRSQKNDDEKHAEKFLEEMGIGTIKFEPSGTTTAPDFLILPGVAVEVTRLNQHLITRVGIENLENARLSLTSAFRSFLHSFKPKAQPGHSDPSWFVGLCFRRPIEKWSSVEPVLVAILERFASGDRDERHFQVNKRLSIHLTQAGTRYPSFFREAGHGDQNAGGFVVPLLKANVQICLKRKSYLLPLLSSYSERWLILVDHVSYGDWEPFEIESTAWSRVILLSPGWPMLSYEPSQAGRPHSR